MGVQGLIPFLRKACPNVFQELPGRFTDIHSKKVVIDGTLITQRFHFAPSPHPYRHILRWYRVAEEMRQSDVTAVCVFDGKGRHSAKTKEITRRRAYQKLTATRGQIESARLRRLKRFQAFLASLPLPLATLKPTLDSLKALNSREDVNPAVQHALHALKFQASDGALSKLSPGEATDSSARYGWQQSVVSKKSENTTAFLEKLPLMFQEFLRSISQIATFTKADARPPLKTIGLDPETEQETELDALMTKAQSQLVLYEKSLWDDVVNSPLDDEESCRLLRETCADLVKQSSDMSTSFDRRTNPPTFKTYQQSQEILKAMGIPCILSEGDTEAEGLASSMVLNGFADYVVSEDTDVLVYGAPLLRNLTGHDTSLEIISAKDIQASLSLSDNAYVDFALLLGTDFSERLKNVGPVRALDFINNHGSIERILEAQPKYPPRNTKEEYLDEINAARSIFRSRPETSNLVILSTARDEAAVSDVMTRYGHKLHVEPEDLLVGGYFHDTPIAA